VALLFGAWWQQLLSNVQRSRSKVKTSNLEHRTSNLEQTGLWLARLSGYLCATFFLFIGGVLMVQAMGPDFLGYIHPFLHPKDQANLPLFARFVTDHLAVIFAWLSITGLTTLFLLWALSKHSWGPVFTCLTVLMVATLLLVSSTFHPTLAQDRTFKPFMARVSRVVDAKTPLFFYRSFDYGALFYARRHIPRYFEQRSMGAREQRGGVSPAP
jgi:hypothetical protein